MASTITTSVVTGGTNSHATSSAEVNAVATDFIHAGVTGPITNTSGVAPNTGSFAVNAQGTPAMFVDVTAGSAWITATPSGQSSQKLRANMTANYVGYAISANSSGSTKYDWIYLSVDATKANNPASDASDVTSLYTSRSSSNTTDNGTPPAYGQLLAIVTVANGASSITNSNITDKRRIATFRSSPATSAVNALDITASATGTDPKISATGDDANIGIKFAPKGTGTLTGVVENMTNPYKFSAYNSSTTSMSQNTFTKIAFQTEIYDTGSNFDSSTNYRFVAPVAGYYHFEATVGISSFPNASMMLPVLYLNGTAHKCGGSAMNSTTVSFDTHATVSGLLKLAASDYVEVYVTETAGGTQSTLTGTTNTFFMGHLVSVA